MERETRVKRSLDARLEAKIPEVEGKQVADDAETETDNVDQEVEEEEEA